VTEQAAPEKVERCAGRGIPVRGDDIDTDQIIPARYLRSIRFAGLEEGVFRDLRFAPDGSPLAHPFNEARFAGASILLVNRGFGCGSSREHAPQALMRWGIRAIIGESFAEIFFGNCTVLGIPALSAPPAELAALMAAVEADPRLEIEVDVRALEARWSGGRARLALPEAARSALLDGSWDALGTLLSAEPQVRATAQRLPYLQGF
jgi:3-isopropylmalate/(R)-2-methylmalate dehydratase small subunit